jgi:hypothetical protein
MNGWQGVFEPKTANGQRAPPASKIAWMKNMFGPQADSEQDRFDLDLNPERPKDHD